MKKRKIVENMTLDEKASLMSGKDFWQTQDLPKHNIPSLFLADGPHGVRKQAAAADHLGLNESLKSTCFPTAVSLANTWNKDLVCEVGKTLGKEAKSQRVNVLLGPGTNIKRNPLCGRNFEYYSEDPFLAGNIVSSQIKGIQSSGVSACVKHFAANNQEERRLVIDSIIDERTLREIYLTPFEMAVKDGKVKALMSAYNKVNGVYANENNHLLREILRNEWGFKGVLITDWGGNNDRIQSLIAGSDLEMPGNAGETNKEIVKAIKEGILDEKYLDEAVNRLLDLAFTTDEEITNNQEEVDIEKHHNIAYEAASEAIVLLKNENNTLPLNNKERVAIIGNFAKEPRYQGAGSSIVNPTILDRPHDFIKEYDLNYVGFAEGFKRYGKRSKKLIKEAKNLALKSDVILLYVGLDELTEVEGLDRSNMKLPKNQLELISELSQLNKKIILVLSCGSAIEMPFAKKVNAIVHGYLLGQAGARAMLDVLVGKVNPSGRLSESIPVKYEEVSSAPYFPGKEISVEYREGLYIGYRYFEKNDIPVTYSFGFGLSYTDFAYSDLIIDEKGVKFKIKNIGNIKGKEVAQLYIGKKDSKIFRAKKELKGFIKVEVEPNETKEVEILFDEYTFRYWNVKTNKFEIESGIYEIYISKSINHNCLLGTIELNGTTDIIPYDKNEVPSYFLGDIKKVELTEFIKLLGFEPPYPFRKYVKKNRIIVEYNTTVAELKFAKGWTGRIFAWGISVTPKILRFFGKKQFANTIYMGMYHQPMRGLSRMSNGGVSWGQLDGLILMFNGKFFKGLAKFLRERKKKKAELKVRKGRKSNG